ncbi:MAG: SUF system Fe-S cluster assembly regulator [Deltaproteobacteria bacterium CG2_30_66_27]|nr:MAG: SUF system Fe-S cluster assembly regulator [Deltaproteobacteria bacterium CG2_30_66_27]
MVLYRGGDEKMLRVSKLADYGTLAISYLALEPGEGRTAREIAAAIRVAAPTVSKILKILARNGLLVSLRGAGGGYRLALRPDRISVARVVEAVEGPFAFTECSGTPCHCIQEANCPVGSNWKRINRDVRKVLESVTLADMVRPARSRPDPTVLSRTRSTTKENRATRAGRVSAPANRGGDE